MAEADAVTLRTRDDDRSSYFHFLVFEVLFISAPVSSRFADVPPVI
jgi:hypothetical protein